jgi:serine/threonine protein kinase
MLYSTPLTNLLGSIIDNGRLHLVEPLGRGSGGVVFRAVDTQTQTKYAVKCVYKAQRGTRQFIFQNREFQFQQSISGYHGIVTLHRVVEEDPFVFMVMDLCEGGDLFKFITDKGTFRRNVKRVKSVMLQLIDTLDVCHRNGIYHRDVKPENIMCNEDATYVRLGDFGLATDHKWSKNFGAGTSGYMSPGTLPQSRLCHGII